jgi:adenylate kinase
MFNIFKNKKETMNIHLGDCSVEQVKDGVNSEAYIFIGRSGCGKGTQVELFKKILKEKRGNTILHVETGAFLREFIKGDSYVQKMTAEILKTGGLVVEPILVALWGDYLMKNYSGKEDMVFDGAPRKLQEALLLDSMLNFLGIKKYKVIHINTSIKWCTDRLLARGRGDDTKEGIAKRMEWYDTEVMKSVKFFETNKNCEFINVNGEQTIEQVYSELINKVFNK